MGSSVSLCLGFAVFLAATASGCAKRLPLSPGELERVTQTAGQVQPLRVYPSHRLFAVYRESNVQGEYRVQKTIQESSERRGYRDLITKNTAGLIVKVGEQNGEPALWVTFDPRYTAPEDAMLFVQSADGIFRLSHVPERQGFDPPTSYHGFKFKSRELEVGKMKSLAEPNDVMLVKKPNGKILTIDLMVKKVTSDRTQERTRRVEGID